jgi:phage anti-repressor protein
VQNPEAMMARTEKGREIRMWYLELGKKWRLGKLDISPIGLEIKQQLSKLLEAQSQIEFQQHALFAKTEHLSESFEAHEKWLQGIDAELDRIESPFMALFHGDWLCKPVQNQVGESSGK